MEKRYRMPGILRKNLEGCGYEMPTGIQGVGVPIMLEVHPCSLSQQGKRGINKSTFQGRDLAAVSPTGTGKTMSYLLPVFSLLGAPAAKDKSKGGVRALVLSPTRELATQIYNEALKLAQGRKWRVVLFSKATAATLKDPAVRGKVGGCHGWDID
jgi:ATP-dependent RNA helicase DDX52/ROK1